MRINAEVKLVATPEQPNEESTVIPHRSPVGSSSSADIGAFKKSEFEIK